MDNKVLHEVHKTVITVVASVIVVLKREFYYVYFYFHFSVKDDFSYLHLVSWLDGNITAMETHYCWSPRE